MDVLIEVVVSGAAGRLGRRLCAHVHQAEGLTLAGALVRAGGAGDGAPVAGLAPELAGVEGAASADLGLIAPGRVLLEVSPKAAALAHLARAEAAAARVVLATTGFDAGERARIEAAAARIPVLLAPNLSLGVAVLVDLARRAAAALPGYHLEILELHHAKKRAAPSGTAWALARAVAEARGQDAERDTICARAGEIGARGAEEIGLQAIRGGDIIGEHTVYLVGPTERLELTHRAASRDLFAAGGVAAARFLGRPGRPAGLYTMQDVAGAQVEAGPADERSRGDA